ncbi:MAG: THxN family PEP-CTERM protein [Pseudomonadota bacterium]
MTDQPCTATGTARRSLWASALSCAVALLPLPAQALIVTQWQVTVDSTFDPASIVDSEGNTPGDVTISNSDRTLSWGSGSNGPSGLEITNSPVNTIVDTSITPTVLPPVGNVFVTHNNQPITGNTLDRVSMLNEITLTSVVPPGSSQPPTVLSFLIDFQETANNPDPCPDGGANGVGVNANGCGDIFVIGADALNYSFFYDGGDGVDQEYFISFVEVTNGLQSLSPDACLSATGSADPCLGFVTPEQASTSFQFGTIITTDPVVVIPPEVPAPGVLGLMGLGLVIMRFVRRRPA